MRDCINCKRMLASDRMQAAAASFIKHWTQVEQFALIFIGFFSMGAALGFERSLLPRMAIQVFGETKATTRLHFVATFGLSKALANAIAGPLADQFGRKPMLLMGCLIGLPVMPYVTIASKWTGITVMNAAFGLSQGLIGSSLFFLAIDLLGPKRRGVAVGVGESTIYVSTAVVNVFAGHLASKYGYRPIPFYVATGFAGVGLLSTLPLRDTLDQVRLEQSKPERENAKKYARMMSTQPSHLDEEYNIPRILSTTMSSFGTFGTQPQRGHTSDDANLCISPWSQSLRGTQHSLTPSFRNLALADEGQVLRPKIVFIENYESFQEMPGGASRSSVPGSDESSIVSFLRQHKNTTLSEKMKTTLLQNTSYMSLCIAGMVLNFKDGFAWGSFPVFFKHEHSMTDANTDRLVALYPLTWGFAQAFAGALSDRYGRRIFLNSGVATCSIAMALFAVPKALWGVGADARHVHVWIIADVLLGLGTALVYPALQAAAADEVDPVNRGLALGFYRFVRDLGYVIGALVCGRLTDTVGYESTFLINALVLAMALLSLVVFFKPKSDEDAAVAIWIAAVVRRLQDDVERDQEETGVVDNERAQYDKVPSSKALDECRILVPHCSDAS